MGLQLTRKVEDIKLRSISDATNEISVNESGTDSGYRRDSIYKGVARQSCSKEVGRPVESKGQETLPTARRIKKSQPINQKYY
jgi:hypothetical protein